MQTKRIFMIIVVLFMLSGCQTLNPYDEDSDCPDPFGGDCVSMTDAYRRSKANPTNAIDPRHDSPLIKDRPQNAPVPLTGGDYAYKNELYQEIAGLVQQPITPVRIPAKNMRVLILGYQQEDRFYSHRYVFFESDQPRWLLDIIEE